MSENGPWFTENWWVTEYNYIDDVRTQFTLPEKVYFHDVTLREAEQSPGVVFKKDEQIKIAKALDQLGVQRIEMFPAATKKDVEAFKEILDLGLDAKTYPLTFSKKDVDLALDCGADGILVGMGSSNPWTFKTLFGIDEDEWIRRQCEIIEHAKECGLFVVATIPDAFRAPVSFLKLIFTSVKEVHADNVCIRDTFGFALPWTTQWMVRKAKEWADIPVEYHAHNDFGLATAGTIAAVVAGASVVHTSINGLGERAGNTAFEEVAVALELLLGIKTGIKFDELHSVSSLVEEISRIKIPPNKPILGDFLHTTWSGLHVKWRDMCKQKGRITAFTPFETDFVGKPPFDVKLGKMSGNYAVYLKLKELGIEATREQTRKIVEEVKKESIVRKNYLSDFEVARIARKIIGAA